MVSDQLRNPSRQEARELAELQEYLGRLQREHEEKLARQCWSFLEHTAEERSHRDG